MTATKICCNAIVETLFLAKEWKLLNEHILLLAKRRSQLKQVNRTSTLLYPACKHFLVEVCTEGLRMRHKLNRTACSRTISIAVHAMQAIQSFVRQSMAYIPQTPDKETRIELIKTLQTVTEGKASHLYYHLCFEIGFDDDC